MDVFTGFASPGYQPITCIELHTVGMPTRIVVAGYPELRGTLAEQKASAAKEHDYLRKRILFEPRGHFDMFGAILRPDTEHTQSGRAHMGVLYIHPGGYSNMCGHATLALGRFLVDTHDESVFPQRDRLTYDPYTQTTIVILHTPGGIVEISVPTTPDGSGSDPTRPVGFNAIPAYALTTEMNVAIPRANRWPELGERDTVQVSLAYCSAFSCQVSLQELGFPCNKLAKRPDLGAIKLATRRIREQINKNPDYRRLLIKPGDDGPGELFGIMVVEKNRGIARKGTLGAETGLYLFSDDQHIDRSPTGSMAAARVAVAVARGEMAMGDSWTYHSVVSNSSGASPGFVATFLREADVNDVGSNSHKSISKPVTVKIEGYASYTGSHVFVVEKEDPLHQGFLLEHIW